MPRASPVELTRRVVEWHRARRQQAEIAKRCVWNDKRLVFRVSAVVVGNVNLDMKRLALLYALVFALVAVALADNPSTRRKYVSPDRVFQFSYPPVFVLHAEPDKFHGWLCSSFIVCLEYPREQLYDGYDLGPVEFWVTNPIQLLDVRSSAHPITTEPDCVKFRTYAEPVSTTMINGVKFATLSRSGVAAGTTSDIQLFRTFHAGKCYELGSSLSIAAGGYTKEDYEVGRIKHFTLADQKDLRAVLDGIVRTFRFLK